MTLFLKDIWPILDTRSYKAHFARRDDKIQPLEVLVRDKDEWKGWQEYWPGRNDFNRPLILSLAQFYYEEDMWLFGGVFKVLARYSDRYQVELTNIGQGLIERLKLRSEYRSRPTRVNLENHYPSFVVHEILQEPYSGRAFPGYDDINLSFDELETLVRNDRADWKAALGSIKGIHLITDVKTRKRYVGSAYGAEGIWSRWCNYVASGHGGNVELRALVSDSTLNYCRANFRFALLEHRSARTTDEVVIGRESYWKHVLLTRDDLNRN